MQHSALAVAVLVALGSVSACGGGSSPSTPSPTPNSPTPAATRIIAVSGNLAFGNVAVGATATGQMTIANTGNATLTVTSMTGPTGYAASWLSGTIPAGGSQSVTVTFAPTAAGSYGGTITVVADHTGGTNTIAVSGTGKSAPIGTYDWRTMGGLEYCSSTMCLDYRGTAWNNGTGCATDVWFHVEFYTQEFGSIMPDILVFPVDSKVTEFVRPGEKFGFTTPTVFNTSGRHIIGERLTAHYTAVSCQ